MQMEGGGVQYPKMERNALVKPRVWDDSIIYVNLLTNQSNLSLGLASDKNDTGQKNEKL